MSEDGDQLRLRHSFWWAKFNWRAEILLVHLSALDLTIGQVKFNSTLCYTNSFEFCTSLPSRTIKHCNNFIIAAVNTVLVSVHPMPAEKYKVSVFELVSWKTTYLSIWCQICCKTWIWAHLSRKMLVTRNTLSKGGWGKKTTQLQADDAQAEDQQVEPTNNTTQAG